MPATPRGIPATRLIETGEPLYPIRGDLARARGLAGGTRARVVVFTWNDPPYTEAFNRALREQLAAIGLSR